MRSFAPYTREYDNAVAVGGPRRNGRRGTPVSDIRIWWHKSPLPATTAVSVGQQLFHLRRQRFRLRKNRRRELRMVSHPRIERAHAPHRSVQMPEKFVRN